MIQNKSSLILVFFLVISENAVECLKLGQLCSSNSRNSVRGCDRQGCGHYGARRGRRTHKGSDIICAPGSAVMMPFPGEILGRARPYANNKKLYNNGLYLKGTKEANGFRAKIFYFTPKKISGAFQKGSVLGTSRKLPQKGITQHLHLKLYKKGKIVNPENYL